MYNRSNATYFLIIVECKILLFACTLGQARATIWYLVYNYDCRCFTTLTANGIPYHPWGTITANRLGYHFHLIVCDFIRSITVTENRFSHLRLSFFAVLAVNQSELAISELSKTILSRALSLLIKIERRS